MDDLDNLIIDRLAEHQRKLEILNKFQDANKPAHILSRKKLILVSSIAACIALALFLSPFFSQKDYLSGVSLTEPSFTEFRGSGFNEIEALIAKGDYNKALPIVDRELFLLNDEMEGYMSDDTTNKEKEYTLLLFDMERDELLWSRIYLLAKLRKTKDLKLSCRKYLKDNTLQSHRQEVEEILLAFK